MQIYISERTKKGIEDAEYEHDYDPNTESKPIIQD